MKTSTHEQIMAELDDVSRVVGGAVGEDGQGNGVCPVCQKTKKTFRYAIGEDGRLKFTCHSALCSGKSNDHDQEWLRDVRNALTAGGVERTFLGAGARPTATQKRAPGLPSERRMAMAEEALRSSPALVELLKDRVGLNETQILLAGIGYDREKRFFWLPVEDEDGNLLTIIRRDFRPDLLKGAVKSKIWPGSSGSYLYAPFGLSTDLPVLVCAGERDTLALGALGKNAVCFSNGEGAVPPVERIAGLAGLELIFLYDNDAGNHSSRVASALLSHVGSTRLVEWSADIPRGYDVWDVLNDHQLGIEAIEKAIADARPWGEAEAREYQESAEFKKALAGALLREKVREHLAVVRADALFTVPPSDLNLTEMLKKERVPISFTIDKIHPEGSNSLIAAQYKVGKTTLIANLAKSYADGDRFLGNFEMNPGGGRIALFNYELTEDMLIDLYLKPLEIENSDRVVVLNLRGRNFDLRSTAAFEFGVKWLRERGCDALILDPFGAAARFANENDNSEARNWLLGTLDPFKEAAGVRDLWMPAHTGRAEKEEGGEHVRGASSVDDWADVRWLYSKAKVTDSEGESRVHRFFSANGRGVDVSEREVQFDKSDNSLFVTDFRSRAQARSEGASVQAVRAVLNQDGLKSGELEAAMKGDTAVKKNGIKEAIQKGYLSVEDGPNRSKLHHVTDEGRAFAGAL